MSKKALIFGINGMDGRTLAHLLLSKDYSVVGTYRRVTINTKQEVHSFYDNNPNLSFEYCDINDKNSVISILSKHPDISEIYLLAAQSHVGFSFDSPDTSVITNGMSVYNVLSSVLSICPKAKTYFAATSELFGGANPQKSYNEESPYDCRSPYSIGKELGTRWIKYFRQMGLFVCYGVLFNHSNTYRSKDFFIRRITNAAAQISLGKMKNISLGFLGFYRDEHWSDFGCEMMWKMLQNETPKDYVIANGVTHSGEEFLELSFSHFNLNWREWVIVDQSRFRPNEVVKLIGDSSLAQKELGWRPERIPFKDHIGLMCNYDYALESGAEPVRPDVFKIYP